MSEKFAKIKDSLNETLELLKSKKFDEAIESFTKTIDEVEATEKEVSTQAEELEKTKKVNDEEKESFSKIKDDLKEEMKKWADMYISAESVSQLLEDLKSAVKVDMAKMTEEIETLKNTSA